ncbi:hypothetical protein C3L29_041565, partial [Pseudomonas sp. MWU12-2534b]
CVLISRLSCDSSAAIVDPMCVTRKKRVGRQRNARAATRFACGFTCGAARSYTRRQFVARAVAFDAFSGFQRANDRASRTFVARRQEAP